LTWSRDWEKKGKSQVEKKKKSGLEPEVEKKSKVREEGIKLIAAMREWKRPRKGGRPARGGGKQGGVVQQNRKSEVTLRKADRGGGKPVKRGRWAWGEVEWGEKETGWRKFGQRGEEKFHAEKGPVILAAEKGGLPAKLRRAATAAGPGSGEREDKKIERSKTKLGRRKRECYQRKKGKKKKKSSLRTERGRPQQL